MNSFLLLAPLVLCSVTSSAPVPKPLGLDKLGFLAELAPTRKPGIERQPEDAVFHAVDVAKNTLADALPLNRRGKRLNDDQEKTFRALRILSNILGLVSSDASLTIWRFGFGKERARHDHDGQSQTSQLPSANSNFQTPNKFGQPLRGSTISH